MNVLFLTLVGINSINERGIYQDLLRKFRDEGHSIFIITPVERRKKIATNLRVSNGVNILQVRTLNIQKTNLIEKAIGTFVIEYQFRSAIRKFFSKQRFDIVLYSTPPVTFAKVVTFIKNRDNAYSYLLLKDIFPQNAVDMKLMSENGIIYKHFRKREKMLYSVSDTIGCMSQANVDFVKKHNPKLPIEKIEINPNSIQPIEINLSEDDRNRVRLKYGIPEDKTVFLYGGNLGKPQGISFLLNTICLNTHVFFLIVGDGTEFSKTQKWFDKNKPNHAKLLRSLPKQDYDILLSACDVGLIFLHPDFRIPNFPSRLLSYLEMKKPIIAATDENTDIGDIIEKWQCGYKVVSGDSESMRVAIQKLTDENHRINYGENGWKLLNEEYLVDRSYQQIMNKLIN